MRNTSLFVSITSLVLVASANIAANASTYTYFLNGTYAEATNSGPSLVPYGGTLTPFGYQFGPNMGLSLSNVVSANGPYSIDMHFYFDNINATFDGYERILDFKNRALDAGLYSNNGYANFFVGCCSGVGGTGGSSVNPVFASGQFADLLVTRNASGLFSASVNGNPAFSFLDSTGLAQFTGPNNIIYFFMDDFQSLANYPNTPEAGSGFINFVQVSSDVPEPSTWAMLLLGFTGIGFMAYCRKSAALAA
jgi:hypothetical protein